jgi:hypothetical protein
MGATGVSKRTFVTLGCERSGKYKPNKKDRKKDWTGTKKYGCPFRLRGRPFPNDEVGRLVSLMIITTMKELMYWLGIHTLVI